MQNAELFGVQLGQARPRAPTQRRKVGVVLDAGKWCSACTHRREGIGGRATGRPRRTTAHGQARIAVRGTDPVGLDATKHGLGWLRSPRSAGRRSSATRGAKTAICRE